MNAIDDLFKERQTKELEGCLTEILRLEKINKELVGNLEKCEKERKSLVSGLAQGESVVKLAEQKADKCRKLHEQSLDEIKEVKNFLKGMEKDFEDNKGIEYCLKEKIKYNDRELLELSKSKEKLEKTIALAKAKENPLSAVESNKTNQIGQVA